MSIEVVCVCVTFVVLYGMRLHDVVVRERTERAIRETSASAARIDAIDARMKHIEHDVEQVNGRVTAMAVRR